jgi:Protein of unknown function (DUF2933)
MHYHDSSHQSQPSQPPTRFSLPVKIVLYTAIGIIAYFLITEHLAHLAGFCHTLCYSSVCLCTYLCTAGMEGTEETATHLAK